MNNQNNWLGGVMSPFNINYGFQPRPVNKSTNFVGSDGKQGVYWIGHDGNVWAKGNDGVVTNRGKAERQGDRVIAGGWQDMNRDWRQISDPADMGGGGNGGQSSHGSYYSGGYGGYRGYGGYGGYNARAAAEEARQNKFYQQLIDSLGGRKNADRGMIDKEYGNSFSKLVNARDTAMGNLESESQKLEKQRARAKRQIAENAQNNLQNLKLELGMSGANNLSAMAMGAEGVSKAANGENTDVMEDYSDQMNQIAKTRENVKKEYDDQNNELNTWKEKQYHNLDKTYADLENQYRQKIGGEANLNAIADSFRHLNAPNVKTEKMPEYKAEGIKANIQNNATSPALTSEQAQNYYLGNNAYVKKKEDEMRRPL